MFEGGPMWEPPEKETIAITEEVAKGHLSHVDRDTLEKLLRSITPERRDIARLMVFCIGHADAAAEVVECIAESLTILETPIPVKIARL
jgi:U2-associated protein SR140